MTLKPCGRRGALRALVVVLLAGGCATAAQRQAQQIGTATREATTQSKACIAAVIAKPEYAPLVAHTPNPATMAQLTDESLIAPEQAKLFGARYDELNSCRTHLLNDLSVARPDIVPILASGYTRLSALAVQLIERKITWGEWARQEQALSSDTQQQVAAADRELIAGLNASSQAEMAQRQAAGATLLQWSVQQQMINAINRPVVTNCNRFGSSVNCTSY